MGSQKIRGIFWGCKKRIKGFFGGGYAKKSCDFFAWTNSEVVTFLGIKYEALSDPYVIKISEWGPWGIGNGIE